MSVQLTRPTSKTAMLVRQKRALLEQLSCFLCKGYLIDATTIDECMDSFCKSCIITYLRNHNNCPKCGISIHRTNPLNAIHSDKVLQDIVYKIVPGLYDDEMKRRRDFYDEEDGQSSSSFARSSSMNSEQFGIVSHPKPFYKLTDHIDLSIEPQKRGNSSSIYYDNKRQSIVTCFTGSLEHQPPSGNTLFSVVDGQQFKTYLRCPAKLTTIQLKKFIAAKFNISSDDTIHLLYLNESLKDEYSLIDIAYIYYWKGIEHMRLFYIIERDLNKSNTNDYYLEGQSRKTRPRQTVGTSTQTVKRVCIDPQPRFYEEQNDDNNNVNHFRSCTVNSSGINSINSSMGNTSNTTSNNNSNHNNYSSNINNNINCNNNSNSDRQLVPNMRKGTLSVAPNLSVPPQSSLVTLASFTQARSNNVISMSSAPTATVPSSHRDMRNDRAIAKVDAKSLDTKVTKSTAASKVVPSQSATQLSFSFVTERGITIVRRLNCQDEKASSTANQHYSTSATNQSTSSGASRIQQPSISGNSNTVIESRSSSSGSRHHLKVKPVYKTFVDPTKLKSPNFKKLGLTARH